MRRITLCLTEILLLSGLAASAQVAHPENPEGNIEAGVGIQAVPNHIDVSLRTDLSYARFHRKGIGFRAGGTYTSDIYGLGPSIGVPLSFAWRTFKLDKTYSAPMPENDYPYPDNLLRQDWTEYAKAQTVSGFARLMTNLASSLEIDAGLTPGCIFGETAEAFYLTGDLGLRTSWRIWRLRLSVNPAMHYMVTDLTGLGMPLRPWERWHLSLLFGISIELR